MAAYQGKTNYGDSESDSKELMEEMLKSGEESGPQFKKGYFHNGALFLLCANDAAKTWVFEINTQLQPRKVP